MSRTIVALLVVLSFVAVLAGPPAAIAQPADLATQARELVAQEQGIPAGELVIAETAQASFSLTGIELTEFKVMAADGRTFAVSFKSDGSEVVDAQALADAEQQAQVETYGALDPELAGLMMRNAAERIPVAIWVAMPDPGAQGRGNPEAIANQVRAAQDPVVNEASNQGIGALLARADLVPVLFADLTAGQINGLSRHPNIILIEALPQDLVRHNDDSATSDRYRFVWGQANGSGAKIAVHEDDGVDDVNTFLIDPVYWCTGVGTGPGGSACTVGKNIGSHATNMAGVIASTHPWRRGGAWGLTNGSLLSANFQSFTGTGNPTSTNAQKIVNSAAWALNNGADTINMSWGGCSGGSPNFYSRWVDFLVKAFGDNIVVSSGNNNCGNPDFVGSPSLGWNTISVGSYFDNNTGLRTDDVFSSFSSYKNWTDPNSGRLVEKPDVTGMGGQVANNSCFGTETTAVGGGVGDSTCGTSFAAPDVSALTALIVGKNPAALRNAAEAVKAIVMAGATHNIVDGVNHRDCPNSPVPNDCRDGAGAIDAAQTILNIVNPGNFQFSGSITPTSTYWDANGNHDIPVTIGANKNIRVALAWDSTATCASLGTGSQACNVDVLNADLDLHLIAPNGSAVAFASSFQNSAEVIDFTTTVSGTYTVRVKRFRFDANTTTFAGVAWNLNRNDGRTPLTGVTSFALNTTKNTQTTNRTSSFWDSYNGTPSGCVSFLSAETGLEKVYQIKTTKKGAITATLSNIVGFPGTGSDLDVIILKKTGGANVQNGKMIACGDTVASISNQPAGTYLIVVDGFAGSVANFSLKVNFVAGTTSTLSPQEPLPQR
ncbi:hypothetical protein BH23CHL1_BH23CHL1_19310 [soil metagenome]